MDKRVQTLTVGKLRRMIMEEAAKLASGDVEKVKAKETAWEDEEPTAARDQYSAQGVKKESRIRRLKMQEAQLRRQLQATRHQIVRLSDM
jgi:hypothetical protein